jgi:energy-coupling factor transport system substrate-specific component
MCEKSMNKKKLSRRTLVAAVIIIVLIPAVILLTTFLLDDWSLKFHLFNRLVVVRPYYFSSLLILFFTSVPFFMVFEKRKPQARELIIIATLAAIAVAGRMAFFMVPQFKPVVALVIIAGVSFGGEAGFIVGAVTGFVSNFYFGQGPWTPWQMFCFGIIGFLAGILFQKGLLKTTRLPLCIFGGLATFFIYGGIINLGSALMAGAELSWQQILPYYLTAIPMDAVHAAASVVFLFLISQPMLEKLERIKVKYGLLQ